MAMSSGPRPRWSHARRRLRRDAGERRPQLPQPPLVLVDRTTLVVAEGTLDDGVLVGGGGEVPLDLDRRDDHPLRLDHLVGAPGPRPRAAGSGRGRPALPDDHARPPVLAADDQRGLHLTGGDGRRRPAQQGQLQHARARSAPSGRRAHRRPRPPPDRGRARPTCRGAPAPRPPADPSATAAPDEARASWAASSISSVAEVGTKPSPARCTTSAAPTTTGVRPSR